MADIFISYSRKDFVRRLDRALEKRDYDVWVDLEDIPPTADWMEEVRSGIEGSDAYVFVISPDSIASKVCRQELAYAVEHATFAREFTSGVAPTCVSLPEGGSS